MRLLVHAFGGVASVASLIGGVASVASEADFTAEFTPNVAGAHPAKPHDRVDQCVPHQLVLVGNTWYGAYSSG